jgi:hypothetical protein
LRERDTHTQREKESKRESERARERERRESERESERERNRRPTLSYTFHSNYPYNLNNIPLNYLSTILAISMTEGSTEHFAIPQRFAARLGADYANGLKWGQKKKKEEKRLP